MAECLVVYPVHRYVTMCPSFYGKLVVTVLTGLAVWDGDPLLLCSWLLGFPAPSSAVQTPWYKGRRDPAAHLLPPLVSLRC